jgi:hypothetical protein
VALGAFVFFYATCITLTWVSYMQRKTLPSSVGVRALEAQV